MGRAVVAHAHDAVLLVPLIGQRVEPPLQRDGLVERRLEHTDEPRLRQRLSELADSLKIRRVVRRGDEEIFAHRVKHLVRQLVHAVISLGKHGLEAHGFDVPRLFGHRALALGH